MLKRLQLLILHNKKKLVGVKFTMKNNALYYMQYGIYCRCIQLF